MSTFGLRLFASVLIAGLLGMQARAGAQDKAEVTLTAASYAPPTQVTHRSMEEFLKMVQSDSGGKIGYAFHPNGSLVPQNEMLQAGRTGTVDMVVVATSVFPGEFRFSADAGTLLFLWNLDTFDKALTVLKPQLEAELAAQNLKYLWLTGTATQWFMRKPTDLDNPDWSGRKVRGYGGASNRLIELFGGTKVAIANNELPMAASTGVLDGLGTSLGSFSGWGIEKQLPCMVVTNDAPLISVVAINLDAWNALPPSLQTIMTDDAGKIETKYFQVLRDEERPAQAKFAASSSCVQTFTPAQRTTWQKRLAPIYDEFRQKFGARGVKFIDDVQKAVGP